LVLCLAHHMLLPPSATTNLPPRRAQTRSAVFCPAGFRWVPHPQLRNPTPGWPTLSRCLRRVGPLFSAPSAVSSSSSLTCPQPGAPSLVSKGWVLGFFQPQTTAPSLRPDRLHLPLNLQPLPARTPNHKNSAGSARIPHSS